MTAATGVRVAVIGCGMGGATAALALAKIGATVEFMRPLRERSIKVAG